MKKLIILLLLMVTAVAYGKGKHISKIDFIDQVFEGEIPASATFWYKNNIKVEAEALVNHTLPLRTKYWYNDNKSLWILRELGKTKPITVGIVIEDGAVSLVEVLAYRDSWGKEVREDFFKSQFKGQTLSEDNKLSQPVDGITGATLSVQAIERTIKLALYLHEQTHKQQINHL